MSNLDLGLYFKKTLISIIVDDLKLMNLVSAEIIFNFYEKNIKEDNYKFYGQYYVYLIEEKNISDYLKNNSFFDDFFVFLQGMDFYSELCKNKEDYIYILFNNYGNRFKYFVNKMIVKNQINENITYTFVKNTNQI